MSNPIHIRYVWNKENVEHLFDASYTYQFNHSAKRFIGWLLIALLQYGVVLAFKKEVFAILLFATIMLVYWYYGKKVIARKRAQRDFEKSEFKDKTIEMNIDESGFTLLSPHQEKWGWDEVQEVIALGDDIMLYKHPHFHYIPQKAFASLEEKSRFKSLAKKHHKILGT
jgi:hypothetical protein